MLPGLLHPAPPPPMERLGSVRDGCWSDRLKSLLGSGLAFRGPTSRPTGIENSDFAPETEALFKLFTAPSEVRVVAPWDATVGVG